MSYQDTFIVAKDLGPKLYLRIEKGEVTLEFGEKEKILKFSEKVAEFK